jgi:hypothetical protein
MVRKNGSKGQAKKFHGNTNWCHERFCKMFKYEYLFSGFKANTYLFGSSMTPGKQRLFWPSEEYKATPTQVAWSLPLR